MRKPKLNVSLLRQVIKHLREEPKRYHQSQWGKLVFGPEAPACGTQGCIAGWAVLLSVPQELWRNLFKGGAFEGCGDSQLRGMACAPITPVAQKLLGLTEDEAAALFQAANQTYQRGELGVEEVAKKINLLIRDRTKFVHQYLGQYLGG